MYNGTPGESLDFLRYKRFCEKAATNTMCIQPQTLPPTSAAAKYHNLCVYFQIQEWKSCGGELQPLEWGWKKNERMLMPVLTDMPPAPDELLKITRCNCHTDCSSMRCICKKHNVKHSVAWDNCRGSGCTNSDRLEEDDCSRCSD